MSDSRQPETQSMYMINKFAKIMKLKVLRPNWIKDSFIAGEWLPIEKYELAVLDGLRVGVIGFKKPEMIEIVIFG